MIIKIEGFLKGKQRNYCWVKCFNKHSYMKEEVMTGFPYKQNPKLALLKADGDSLISAMLLTRRSTSLTRRGEQPVLDNAYYLLPRHLLV